MTTRPVVLPDTFSGDGQWEQWLCHGNFGPAKILVRGTKIPGKVVPPDRNSLKNLVRVWNDGPGHRSTV